jgi:integrase
VADPIRTKQGWSVRIRCGSGQNPRFVIPLEDEHAAKQRAEKMRQIARMLVAAGLTEDAPTVLRKVAAQTTDAGVRNVEGFVAELCKDTPAAAKAASSLVTFRQLGEQWTSGELHRRYPDHVKLKASVNTDVLRLQRLYTSIGDVPLRDFVLEHAEQAMAALPEGRTAATRRHYGQLIARLLKLAVYPCKLIERTPLPAGFLPRSGVRPALSYLYPREDAQLLRCSRVPFGMRLLYGFLGREGCRLSEALALRWHHLDLDNGTVRLERTKTGDVRAWALSDGVTRALRQLRGLRGADEPVFPGVSDKAAEAFRAHLELAGVARRELFERSKTRRPIRVHDLRASFITLALANGRSETWVQDRTGHTTSAMLNLYRRQARHAAELNLGELAPLNEALPELCAADQGVSQTVNHDAACGNPVESTTMRDITTIDSTPGVNRTHDRWIRNPLLYPAELRAQRTLESRASGRP